MAYSGCFIVGQKSDTIRHAFPAQTRYLKYQAPRNIFKLMFQCFSKDLLPNQGLTVVEAEGDSQLSAS